jgi:GlpG protein
MRRLGTLTDSTVARRLGDYLLTQGVKVRLDDEPTGCVVWVIDEDRVPAARDIFARFSENPDDPVFVEAGVEARKLLDQELRQTRERQARTIDLRRQWEPVSGATPVTWLVVALCAALFVGILMERRDRGRDRAVLSTVVQAFSIEEYGPNVPAEDRGQLVQIRRGEVWRLLTPAFIHVDLWHIVFNLIMWQGLAAYFELRRGSLRLALLVLLCGVVSNLAQFYWPWAPGPRFLGLSGVVYGLILYLAVKSMTDRRSGLLIPGNLLVFSLVWLILGLTGVIPHVANGSHLGGALAGALLGYTPRLSLLNSRTG